MNGKIGTALSWVGNTIKMLNGKLMETERHELGCVPIRRDVKELHDAFYDIETGTLVQMTEVKTILRQIYDNNNGWDGRTERRKVSKITDRREGNGETDRRK
jgi:hypothetical protein